MNIDRLHKGLYSDLSCRLFGLSYGQIRYNNLAIKNAHWFNSCGEKIGCGDISELDLLNIKDSLNNNEIFILLSENKYLDIPVNLNKSSPGIDYCISNARYICANYNGEKRIFKIHHDQEITLQDGYCLLSDVYNFFNYTPGQDSLLLKKAKIYNDELYYNLKVISLSNGTKWAVGSYNDSIQAARIIIREYLFLTNFKFLRNFIQLSDDCLKMLNVLTDTFDKKTNEIICLLLNSEDNISNYIDLVLSNSSLDMWISMQYIEALEVRYITELSGVFPDDYFAFRL